jgi:phage/plasmid-like protein (TIGR03299 family)
MSQETSLWLNQNTLIGFTEKRGRAWHYRSVDQGTESNHYEGPVPIDDVHRRLFHWNAVEADIKVTVMNADGVMEITDPTRKAIVRPDTGTVLGIFKKTYQMHQYDEWLLDNIANLLDDDLNIGSAGLLKSGAVAWVSVEVPENVVTPEGVEFRPNLLASTSFDGSLATTYIRCVTNVVCDNTMSAALYEKGQSYKLKHTRYSNLKLQDARDALKMIHTVSDEFAAQIAELNKVRVSDKEWSKFIDAIAPVEKDGEALKGRGLTMAESKRDELNRLWNHDERVAPWRGTKWGVVQAMNTFTHHSGIVRGADRPERNMLRAVTGGVDALDLSTLDTLNAVLA